jgi:hypothetical protein
MSVIPALGRLRQEDQEFQASMGYRETLRKKKKRKKEKENSLHFILFILLKREVWESGGTCNRLAFASSSGLPSTVKLGKGLTSARPQGLYQSQSLGFSSCNICDLLGILSKQILIQKMVGISNMCSGDRLYMPRFHR